MGAWVGKVCIKRQSMHVHFACRRCKRSRTSVTRGTAIPHCISVHVRLFSGRALISLSLTLCLPISLSYTLSPDPSLSITLLILYFMSLSLWLLLHTSFLIALRLSASLSIACYRLFPSASLTSSCQPHPTHTYTARAAGRSHTRETR